MYHLPNTVTVKKSRRLRLVGYVAKMGEGIYGCFKIVKRPNPR